MTFARADPPTLVIKIPFEAWPQISLEACKNDDDRQRLRAWLEHHHELADLLDRARELTKERRLA